jgi:hypothetical protein
VRAAADAEYKQKIASLQDNYLKRKAAKGAEHERLAKKRKRDQIRRSVHRLVAGLPKRSMPELMGMYRNCAKEMAGPRNANISPEVLTFHRAILKEWKTRAESAEAIDGYFRWPSTDAVIGDGGVSGSNWPSVGMLSALGYHVGSTMGRRESERRFLLDQLFQIDLPPLNDALYMFEWGSPRTSDRLKKLAETIAALTRHGKRRSRDLQVACDEWEADLEYLYEKYYVGHFWFAWPAIEIQRL